MYICMHSWSGADRILVGSAPCRPCDVTWMYRTIHAVIVNAMMNLTEFYPAAYASICVKTNWSSSSFAMAVLGCRSLVLVNNQVLNKIKIAVRISSRRGVSMTKVWLMYD